MLMHNQIETPSISVSQTRRYKSLEFHHFIFLTRVCLLITAATICRACAIGETWRHVACEVCGVANQLRGLFPPGTTTQ